MQLHPTVCPVGKEYQIMIVTQQEALLSVRVGDKEYYCHSNGIRKSAPGVHKFCVPTAELDKAHAYTVVIRKIIERRPYFPTSEPAVEVQYLFRPIEKTEDIHLYHIADVHGELQQALNIAKYCGKELDLLVINGDISSTSNTFDDMILCYKIASGVTKGEFPCIISRGNHDLRGAKAEELALYMPGDNGKSYYTFRTGCIWGILVDTGEDKGDDHPEYGGTICCHEFRLAQDEMIKNIIKDAENEYAADGVKYRLIISHVPFPFKREDPFEIERPLYTEWTKRMRENMKPDFMLCGHTHTACISECGSEFDVFGQPCTIIVGSDVEKLGPGNVILAGAYIHLNEGQARVIVNTENKILEETMITF